MVGVLGAAPCRTAAVGDLRRHVFLIGLALLFLATLQTGCIPDGSDPAVVNRAADLASLGISNGALSPSFSADETNYTVSVGSTTTSISVTAAVADSRASIRINGQAVPSGQASSPITLALGVNPPITVLVDAPGATKIYNIVVTRAPNPDLESLTLSAGALTPAFAPNITSYSVETGNSTTQTTVTAKVSDSTSTVKINGAAADSGQTFGPISLNVGANNVIKVLVTAENGTTKEYTVTVLRVGTTNLATLTASAGPLAPAFSPSTVAYTMSAPFSTDATTIVAETADTTAAVTVNGQGPVQGGGSFGPFPLTAGVPTVFNVVVTSPTAAAKTYTVTVTRQTPSANANLSSLTVNQGTLNPGFSPAVLGYVVTVGSGVGNIRVTASVADGNASLEINNQPVSSGQGVTVTLNSPAPSVTPIPVTVRAQNGAVQTYTVTVTRAAPASGDASLVSLAVPPASISFSPSTFTYNTSVANGVGAVAVQAVAASGATMTINNQAVASPSNFNVNLNVGANTITIRVTAPAGNSQNYVVNITRGAPPSGDATLSSIVVTPPGGTVSGFTPGNSGPYAVSLPFGTSNATVSVTRSNANASVFINGSQTTALSIPLPTGPSSTPVTILVIAQDTSTNKTYTVNIGVQNPSANAGLSSLSVSSGILTPAFVAPGSSGLPGYAVTVPNTVTSFTVTPAKLDPAAIVTISPAATVNPLPVGNTVFTITVTAQAGNSLSYRVTVTRAAASNNAGLSSLSVSSGILTPAFVAPGSSGLPGYAVTVPNTVTSFTVAAAAADSAATVTIGPAATVNPLPVGNTVFTVTVTAPAGNSLSYVVSVTKSP